jgi:tetratricopeptide (TPR) repeat protein
MILEKRLTVLLAGLCMVAASTCTMPAAAASDPALDAAIRHLQTRWEQIKFDVPEGDKQTALMDELGAEADAVAAKYPDQPAALIWDGILTSERASLAGPFSALGLAKQARDILEKADSIDPAALDAGAPTSLGVLYYRVPGFPIGFGDTAKARKFLEQAVRIAPNGLDAWYFYGDFLYSQSQYRKAAEALGHALKLPPHPDRPIWDQNRRLVIQELLAKIQSRL